MAATEAKDSKMEDLVWLVSGNSSHHKLLCSDLGSRPSEVVVPEVGAWQKKERKKEWKVNGTIAND
ncbi:unnamed protein product [Sphenostylis stenocarpa]|uniref:Uncharacterized protein n=1 Tax=Sphenostylis stenocarpa TaxID=92480 RepID=A0AA86S600_9FABA|nr:unnamed protein product [Sphenostylis stenocarpa]